jgi:hypothetical protein
MDRKTFDEGFKLFKRFIKNERVYIPIMRLLFKNGRKKESLFNEFNSKKYTDVNDWRLIFDRVNLLTAYMWPLDQEEFSIVERYNLRTKWKTYYNMNQ